jgi:hypothetical protein
MRLVSRSFSIAALVSLGWLAGRAQTARPDFEFRIVIPEGKGYIECVRGCDLASTTNPQLLPQDSFHFGCPHSADGSCTFSQIGGWVRK